MKLLVPGHSDNIYSTSSDDPDAACWSDKLVVASTGTVELTTSSEILVHADSSDTHDEGDSIAEADVIVVECFADWDRDSSVNTADITAFLNDWNSGASDADLNGDGSVNRQDVAVFLSAHAAGDWLKP